MSNNEFDVDEITKRIEALKPITVSSDLELYERTQKLLDKKIDPSVVKALSQPSAPETITDQAVALARTLQQVKAGQRDAELIIKFASSVKDLENKIDKEKQILKGFDNHTPLPELSGEAKQFDINLNNQRKKVCQAQIAVYQAEIDALKKTLADFNEKGSSNKSNDQIKAALKTHITPAVRHLMQAKKELQSLYNKAPNLSAKSKMVQPVKSSIPTDDLSASSPSSVPAPKPSGSEITPAKEPLFEMTKGSKTLLSIELPEVFSSFLALIGIGETRQEKETLNRSGFFSQVISFCQSLLNTITSPRAQNVLRGTQIQAPPSNKVLTAAAKNPEMVNNETPEANSNKSEDKPQPGLK